MSRFLKWLGIVLLALLGLALVVVVCVAIWWRNNGQAWLDATVRERIGTAVRGATVEGYHFRMDGLRTDLGSGDVRITGVSLTYDTVLNDSLRLGVYDYLFHAEAATIAMRGLSIWRVVWKREVHARAIEVEGPALDYIIGDRRVQLQAPFQRLRGQEGGRLHLFAVDSVVVRDARAGMHDLSGHLPVLHATGLNITARDMRVVHPRGRRRADLRMGDVDLALDSLSSGISGGYRLHFGATQLSDSDRRGSVDHIVLERTDTLPPAERSTVLDLRVDSLVFDGLDIGGLIADQALRMRGLNVHGARLDAWLDKELPKGMPVPKMLPPAALLDLPFPIQVDSLRLVDAAIHYHERSDATGLWAAIRFDHVQAAFGGIHNVPGRPDARPVIRGGLRATFMGTADLAATYEAPLDGSGLFTFTATMGVLPFAQLDTVTSNLLRLSLREGRVEHMHMEMRGNARRARGRMDLGYTDLVATISAGATSAQRHSMFGSLMDHAMDIEQGGGISDRRRRSYSVERDPERSLFTFIWHFTRTGVSRDLLPGVKERISSLLRKEKMKKERRRP